MSGMPATALERRSVSSSCAVRELLLLAKIEEKRMAEMGMEERWTALGDTVDVWVEREAELERLTDPGAAERWQGGLGQRRSCGRPCAASLSDGRRHQPHGALPWASIVRMPDAPVKSFQATCPVRMESTDLGMRQMVFILPFGRRQET